MTPTESRRRLPMHHRVAVTPEPACHFHPSFFQPLLVRKQEQERPGGGRRREQGKMDGVGVDGEKEDGGEERGRKEERERVRDISVSD